MVGNPGSGRIVIVAARNEADRIGATIDALRIAMPEAEILVADDASTDETRELAGRHGAEVVTGERSKGKGANVTRAAETVVHRALEPGPPTFLLCDADLGTSAGALVALCDAVEAGECDVAVAAFARRIGGGFGLAVGSARRCVERLTGQRLGAPLSGQRALNAEAMRLCVPFAHGFGMEVGIASDTLRAGLRLREYELELDHRPTGRTPAGFAHRARQLTDILRAYSSRKWSVG